ncbi:MAG: hypothetical protein M1814_005090 [Vezdaea aestivalis]|nr:MAG: hypothetical protein M1814_005090 [Vezdaea aestivalis]
METDDDPTRDDSSIQAVSSLRSHFEKIGATPKSSRDNSPGNKGGRAAPEGGRISARTSLDIPRRDNHFEAIVRPKDSAQFQSLRPLSRSPPPSGRIPPPGSTHKPSVPPPSLRPSTAQGERASSDTVSSRIPSREYGEHGVYFQQSALPKTRPAQPLGLALPRQSSETRITAPRSPFLHPSEADSPIEVSEKSLLDVIPPTTKAKPVPPPINRTDKPRILATSAPKPQLPAAKALAPISVRPGQKLSPFSTPPSSDDSVNVESAKGLAEGLRNALEPSQPTRPPQVFTTLNSTRRPAPPPPLASRPKATNNEPKKAGPTPSVPLQGQERKPHLPTRRDMAGATSISSRNISPSRKIEATSATPGGRLVAATTSQFLPPPKRKTTSSPPMETNNPGSVDGHISQSYTNGENLSSEPRDEFGATLPSKALVGSIETSKRIGDFPDLSHINRRPPRIRSRVQQIDCRHDARGSFAVCGEYVCTAGHSAKVWSLRSGDSAVNIGFETDGLRVTAACFKSALNIGNEGSQIWLGFNNGDISELDVLSRSIKYTRSNAHNKRDVLRIFRSGKFMWTLDTKKVAVWAPIDGGLPDLRQTPDTFSVPDGLTFAFAVGQSLWIGSAVRQEVHLSVLNLASSTTGDLFSMSLTDAKTGIITSGAISGIHPDKVFLGHLYGDISIYSQKDFACLSIVKVGTHKIGALAGVGDYLWAGFGNGLMCVYDTGTTPWTLKKEWPAHDHVLRVVADNCSPWKMDRVQVVSLGSDNLVKVWDGTLGEDWLDSSLQSHDTKFCTFDEVNALVVTWNAGASKPHDLRYDERDANFFRELFKNRPAPEILVFGFQELVDLERKSTAARSLFHSSKKKDTSEQEHMRHQYREWRSHLERIINEIMPGDDTYFLYHNASLIGLFTCVFIKSAAKKRVKKLDASEVKRGMGGLTGNKGAIIIRFLFDDSSICFLNCHLAAGQDQSKQRNIDLAAILESSDLAPERNPINQVNNFVGGGDGSMVLDHEICILNGDLNYRISSMTRDGAIKAAKALDLPRLLERDQLLQGYKSDPEFRLRAFNEAPICFPPTYKYDVGTDTYDTSSKARVPSWCDRILYRGLGRVKQLDYCRHEVHASDHRPVSAAFKFWVKTVSSRERDAAWEQCNSDLESFKARVMWQTR